MHTTCRLIVLLSVSCVYSIKMTPGSNTRVKCSLENVNVVTWYQQRPEKEPIEILTYNSKSVLPPKYLNEFTSTKMKPSGEAPKLELTIEEVTENDCGIYYCAKKVDDHFEFGEPNNLTCEDTSATIVHSDGVYSIKMTPGSNTQIKCNLEDVSVITWYQQVPKEQPIAILTYNSKSFLPPKYLNGFTIKKMKPSGEASKLTLTIEEVTEDDCGIYYCAKKVDDHFEFGEPSSLTCYGTETPMSDMTQPCEEDVTSWKYAVGGLLVVITLLLGLCMMLCIQTKEKKWTPDTQNQSCLKCTSRLD